MIKIIIQKQLKGDPVIQIYKNGVPIALTPKNVEITMNKLSFELDVKLKPGRKKKK